jgi:hypothetical protein
LYGIGTDLNDSVSLRLFSPSLVCHRVGINCLYVSGGLDTYARCIMWYHWCRPLPTQESCSKSVDIPRLYYRERSKSSVHRLRIGA